MPELAAGVPAQNQGELRLLGFPAVVASDRPGATALDRGHAGKEGGAVVRADDRHEVLGPLMAAPVRAKQQSVLVGENAGGHGGRTRGGGDASVDGDVLKRVEERLSRTPLLAVPVLDQRS